MLPILQGGGKPNDSDHDPPSDDTGYNLDTEEHMQGTNGVQEYTILANFLIYELKNRVTL